MQICWFNSVIRCKTNGNVTLNKIKEKTWKFINAGYFPSAATIAVRFQAQLLKKRCKKVLCHKKETRGAQIGLSVFNPQGCRLLAWLAERQLTYN